MLVLARYWMVKLLQVHAVRALAQRMDRRTTQSSEGGPGVVVNLVNPGLCRTAFGDDMTGVGAFIFHTLKSLIGRTSEVGSRNLVAAVTVGPEGHGRYITDCEINEYVSGLLRACFHALLHYYPVVADSLVVAEASAALSAAIEAMRCKRRSGSSSKLVCRRLS